MTTPFDDHELDELRRALGAMESRAPEAPELVPGAAPAARSQKALLVAAAGAIVTVAVLLPAGLWLGWGSDSADETPEPTATTVPAPTTSADAAPPGSSTTTPPTTSVVPTTTEVTTTAPTTTAAPTTTTEATGTTTIPPGTTTTTVPGPTTTTGPGVPWDRVGDGWMLVVTADWSDIAAWTDRQVWLVSPDGERHLLEEIAGGDWLTIADWSSDRRSVLQRNASSLALVDLVTRESTVILEGDVTGAKFTRPTGRNLVVQVLDGGRVEWRSRTGELLGILVDQAGLSWEYSEWIYGEDGTHLVIGVEDALLHLTADGRLIGELAVPDAALDGTACHPRKWWPDGRVLAACVVDTGTNATADALFLIPLDGGPPERLSPDPTLHPQRGYGDAWPYGAGTLLQWASYGLGGGQQLLHPDGTVEDLRWDLPNPPGADHLIEVESDRIVIYNRGGIGPGETGALVAVTPSTGEVRVLFPGNVAEGGVLSVIVPGNPGIGARATP